MDLKVSKHLYQATRWDLWGVGWILAETLPGNQKLFTPGTSFGNRNKVGGQPHPVPRYVSDDGFRRSR